MTMSGSIETNEVLKPANPTGEKRKKRLSDLSLLQQYEQGDQKAFERLFRRYREPLYRFVLRFLRDEQASADAVQDVFLKVLKDPTRFEARSRFSTWLHAIARNLCLDLLRKKKIRNHPSLSQPTKLDAANPNGPPLVEQIACDQPPTDEQASRRPLRIQLLVAIRSIPIEQRRVFLLRELAGMRFVAISQLLGIPVNTAKSRMRYALINLRRALWELGEEHFAQNQSDRNLS